MAGAGSRFKEAGYSLPKPLIPILGKPMIEQAISTLDLKGDYIFIIPRSYDLSKLLHTLKPNSKIIELDYITRGAAETALLAERYLAGKPLIITNCDQIMHWNGSQFQTLIDHTDLDGMVVTYFKDNPRNSYARVDLNGIVTEIREKSVISNISLNGIHFWKDGADFIESAHEMIRANDHVNGEYYIAPTYNHMINKGKRIGIYHIPTSQHHAVGIPEDLAKYESYIRDLNA